MDLFRIHLWGFLCAVGIWEYSSDRVIIISTHYSYHILNHMFFEKLIDTHTYKVTMNQKSISWISLIIYYRNLNKWIGWVQPQTCGQQIVCSYYYYWISAIQFQSLETVKLKKECWIAAQNFYKWFNNFPYQQKLKFWPIEFRLPFLSDTS